MFVAIELTVEPHFRAIVRATVPAARAKAIVRAGLSSAWDSMVGALDRAYNTT